MTGSTYWCAGCGYTLGFVLGVAGPGLRAWLDEHLSGDVHRIRIMRAIAGRDDMHQRRPYALPEIPVLAFGGISW